MDDIRFGLHRVLRMIRQDFSRATPCSAGARAAESARLTVRWVSDSSPLAGVWRVWSPREPTPPSAPPGLMRSRVVR